MVSIFTTIPDTNLGTPAPQTKYLVKQHIIYYVILFLFVAYTQLGLPGSGIYSYPFQLVALICIIALFLSRASRNVKLYGGILLSVLPLATPAFLSFDLQLLAFGISMLGPFVLIFAIVKILLFVLFVHLLETPNSKVSRIIIGIMLLVELIVIPRMATFAYTLLVSSIS